MIHATITGKELRKALKEIEAAEANGFMFCLSVFKLTQAGQSISDDILEYSDLLEKAHLTNGNFNWGRFQDVTKRNKFVKGKLVKIKP